MVGRGKGNLRELEGWCSCELEVDVDFTSLVDVVDHGSALADLHCWIRVDGFADILSGSAFTAAAHSNVGNACDDEFAWRFGNALEFVGCDVSFSLAVLEVVEDVKWSLA